MRRILLTSLLVLAGCAAPIVLDPPPTGIPDNIDFTGYWSLQRVDNRQQATGSTQALIIPKNRRAPVRRSRSEPGSSARVFLESGNELKITQAESALFVSFDRSIVEEYRFGVLRQVSVGPIEAQRSAGWVGETLEVKTLDEDGALLTERWTLKGNGDELVREVRLVHKDDVLLRGTQLFRRRNER